MALMLTRAGVMSRMHHHGSGARGLMRNTDAHLRRDLRIVRTGEIVLSSFAFGVIQGKHKDKGGAVVMGLPVDLLAGAAFHVLGLLPFARHYSHHLAALGDGALASFFTTTGYRVGERWSKGGSLTSGIAGLFGDSATKPISGGSSIADRELSSLVRS
jgi:heme/copper-type cytochrome/quinol oxidase subunit 3